jgi:hypothetical protein
MRNIAILGCLLCSLGIQAQPLTYTEEDFLQARYDSITARRDSVWTRKDPLYLQLYGGINKSANENLPWSEFSSYPWAMGAFLGLGREITPLWGWRAALRLNHNKSRNVQECEDPDTWGWNNWALFGDATFDLTDAFGKKKTRIPRFNLKAFAGIGVAYTWEFDQVPLSYTHPYSRSSKLIPAARAGVTATWRMSDCWRVGTELSHTMFEDHFNGVAYDFPLDGRTNLKIGLTYLFLRQAKPKAKPFLRLVKLKECPPLPLIIPDPEENKHRQIRGRAFLDFPVNETIIYPEYRKNPEELNKIRASIDSAMFHTSVTITSISLHGYASPESPYSNNTRLAKGRTEALKNYIIRDYQFDPKLFKTDYTPEDWDNLVGFLTNMKGRKVKGDFWYDSQAYVETPEAPDMLIQYRNELLRVIGRPMDPDAKEELLKKVGGGEPYKWLLQHVYPGLRHTDYIIDYDVKPLPVKQARRLIYTHPEALSLEEMFRVAVSYDEGSEGWYDVLLIAAKRYPNDETANLNAACACVKTKRLNDAKKYLEKAGNTPEVRYLNNIIKAMEGDAKWKMENNRVVIIE